LEDTDLFFEWDLGLAVFAGGLGEEQLTRNNNNTGKILLIILIIFLNLQFTKSVLIQWENLAFNVFIPDTYPSGMTKLIMGLTGLKTECLNIV